MWNLTREAKEQFRKCNLLPIQESDRDWDIAIRDAKEEGEDIFTRLTEQLEEVKEELLTVIPNRFVSYIENGTLNQPTLPKKVREDYLQWMASVDRNFEGILDLAYQNTEKAALTLPCAVQEIFRESLHDAVIERIERHDNELHLYINTEGGFTTKSIVHLIFKNVLYEEADHPLQTGQFLIYYELINLDKGYAFRVLFDGPDSQWTITMKEMDAHYYYRPPLNDTARNEKTAILECINHLKKEQNYWFITPHFIVEISDFLDHEPYIKMKNGEIRISESNVIVIFEKQQFTYSLKDVINFIYTNVYEDPYAHFSEPVPMNELEGAAFSNDLELQVRAWNTMYANPTELIHVINRILLKTVITEANELMVSIYVNHFYKEGILSKETLVKYKDLISVE